MNRSKRGDFRIAFAKVAVGAESAEEVLSVGGMMSSRNVARCRRMYSSSCSRILAVSSAVFRVARFALLELVPHDARPYSPA